MAEIQFARGVAEEVVPDVRMTRAKDGSDGTATFYFDEPKALMEEGFEVTGLYLVDEEGEIVSREVNAKFINGAPAALEARLLLKSVDEWDRFMRFMNRYAEKHGLGLTKN